MVKNIPYEYYLHKIPGVRECGRAGTEKVEYVIKKKQHDNSINPPQDKVQNHSVSQDEGGLISALFPQAYRHKSG